jgi:hypothetical protein
MSIRKLITRLVRRRRPAERALPADEDARRLELLVQSGIAANKLPPR